MLTDAEVQAARAKYNITPAATQSDQAPAIDKAAELDKAWAAAPHKPAISDLGGGHVDEAVRGAGSDIMEHAGNIGKDWQDLFAGKIEAPEVGVRTASELFGGINDIISRGVGAAGALINDATGGKLGEGVKAIAQTPLGQAALHAISKGKDAWDSFAAENPRLAKDLQIIPEGAQLIANVVGGGAAKEGAVAAATDAEKVLQKGTDIAKAGAEAIAKPVKSVANVGGKIGAAGVEQATALKPEVFTHIFHNPELYTDENMSAASRQHLGELVQAAANTKATAITDAMPKAEQLGDKVKNALIARVQALREHATKYPTGGDDALPGAGRKTVKVDPNWLADQFENKDVAGVTFDKEGRIYHGDASSPINRVTSPEGARRLQDLWDTWGPEFAKGVLSRAQFIDFRQHLAQIANYRGGVDTALEKTADRMRDNFNADYRRQVPGLEKLDAEHTKMNRDIERLSKGLVVTDPQGQMQLQEGAIAKILNMTKDTKSETAKQLEELVPGITKDVKAIEDAKAEIGRLTAGLVDEKGHLIETAVNKIANSSGTGKDVLAQRLEELVPGIGQKIQFLRHVESIREAGGIKVGTYARGGALGLGAATMNPWVIAAVALTHPAAAVPILRGLGMTAKAARSFIEGLGMKISGPSIP